MNLHKLTWYLSIGILAATVAVSGCRKKYDFEEDDEEGGGGAAAMLDMTKTGTVSGKVIFEGTPPPPKVADLSGDAFCSSKSAGSALLTSDLVVTNGNVGNVFVYVSQGLEGKQMAPPKDPVVFNQDGCKYDPHVAGVIVGQPVRFVNSDATLHNVHSKAKGNKNFNIAQASAGQQDDRVFDKQEIMVPVSCDVHGWMRTYVGVLPHPCFAVTKEDGTFSFKAPPGSYTLTAWHETLGETQQKVTVAENGTADVTFTFKAK